MTSLDKPSATPTSETLSRVPTTAERSRAALAQLHAERLEAEYTALPYRWSSSYENARYNSGAMTTSTKILDRFRELLAEHPTDDVVRLELIAAYHELLATILRERIDLYYTFRIG